MSGSKRVGFPSCSLEAQHSPPFHPRISLFCIVLFIPISPIQVQVPSVHGKYMLHGYWCAWWGELKLLCYGREMTGFCWVVLVSRGGKDNSFRSRDPFIRARYQNDPLVTVFWLGTWKQPLGLNQTSSSVSSDRGTRMLSSNYRCLSLASCASGKTETNRQAFRRAFTTKSLARSRLWLPFVNCFLLRETIKGHFALWARIPPPSPPQGLHFFTLLHPI